MRLSDDADESRRTIPAIQSERHDSSYYPKPAPRSSIVEAGLDQYAGKGVQRDPQLVRLAETRPLIQFIEAHRDCIGHSFTVAVLMQDDAVMHPLLGPASRVGRIEDRSDANAAIARPVRRTRQRPSGVAVTLVGDARAALGSDG